MPRRSLGSVLRRDAKQDAKQARRKRRFRAQFEQLENRRLLTAEIEPNNTPATGTPLPANETLEGVLTPNDNDYFVATLSAGEQLEIRTFNQNAPLFEPTLPPRIDVFDPNGDFVNVTTDGRNISFVAGLDGDYPILLSSENAFGSFFGDYAMQSVVRATTTTAEAEPNGTNAEANLATPGRSFTGTLADANDLDIFSLNVQQGDIVSVATAGVSGPRIDILDPNGDSQAVDTSGFGTAFRATGTGPLYFVFTTNDRTGPGDYTAVINVHPGASLAAETGDTFDEVQSFDVSDLSETVVGVLEPNDHDIFRFEQTEIGGINFNIAIGNNDRIAESGKELRLYNRYGQLVEVSPNSGRLNTLRTDAITPGTYYLEILADSPVGAGPYELTFSKDDAVSLQRDNALHYMDFDSMDPYLGFDRVNAFGTPEAIPFVVGMFNAKLKQFGAEATLEEPVSGNERVASGIGDFGDIGAGGFGSGMRGIRSSQGNTVNSFHGNNFGVLGYYGTSLVNHEFGHGTGLPHARQPQAFMSYVGTTDLLPVGDSYAFQGTDSRRPRESVYDVRNYLDFYMTAGANVVEPPKVVDEFGTQPTDLEPYFREMTVDHQPVQTEATDERPFYTVAGDFNDDGRPDLAVATDTNDTIDVFITGADGTLGAPTNFAAGGNIRQWTDALAVGDFDLDGDDDLAVASFNDSRITIHQSNGDGTFANGVNYAVPREPQDIEVVDIDGDNDLDLVVALVATNQATIFLNAGDGTFSQSGSVPTGDNTHSIAAADLNFDGNVDFVAANSGSDTLTVAMNDGTGNFQIASTINVQGARPESVVVADFDNDGLFDLAVADPSFDARHVEVFLGRGGDDFIEGGIFPMRLSPWNMVADDLDDDGNVDLLIGGDVYAAQVLLGGGDGTFSRNISIEAGVGESSFAVADFDLDGDKEFAVTKVVSGNVSILDDIDDPSNDRVTVLGSIFGTSIESGEPDRYTVDVLAGERWTFDIDSAEFQYPLDSRLNIYDPTGLLIATSDDALDRNSGIRSVDPFIDHTFASAGEITIEVEAKLASSGDYRLRVTPGRAFDTDGPKVIAAFPDNGASVNGTNQLMFIFDDLLDPNTLTPENIVVQGTATGVVSGTAYFNPFESVLYWTADRQLVPDDYSVTLNGESGGIADFYGNVLDGEIAPNFSFPEVSGDDSVGGSFQTQFTISAADTTPASVTSSSYLRDPYNRGRFTLRLNDALSASDVHATDFTLRGAGSDGIFDTEDDTVQGLDPVLDPIRSRFAARLYLYSRGIPDSGLYRIEGSTVDAAGMTVNIAETITVGVAVPESALFTSSALTTSGLAGSYIDQSLENDTTQSDWRNTQTVAGTRVDPQVDFERGGFGDRTTVGITGGADDQNWDNFSIQWDGVVQIPAGGASLFTRSDDGSRFWVDIDGDGSFDGVDELFNNGWGQGQGVSPGEATPVLPQGTYQIRIQYYDIVGGEAMHLDWVLPGQPVADNDFIHGPSVTDVSIRPGEQITQNAPSHVSATFSSSIDPSTLTTNSFVLRHSENAEFFDEDDTIIPDVDGIVSWDPTTNTATLNFADPLGNGFYMMELDGDPGGIANSAGHLLDGEFLSSVVIGNDDPFIWEENPSGNGIQGGDFRTTFVVAQPEITIDILDKEISERGGQTVAVITRRFSDLRTFLNVSVSISDTTELATDSSISIPAGQESVAIVLSALDDDLIDGDQVVTVQATAAGVSSGATTIVVTDYEELDLDILDAEISEKDGATELIIRRLDASDALSLVITSDRPDKASATTLVTMPASQATISVPVRGVDNNLVDGTQTVTFTVSSAGTVPATISLDVTDHEQLTLNINEDSVSENGGVATATLSRTDSTTNFFALLSADPGGQLSFPQSIQFTTGNRDSNPFEIRGVDNSILDGTRTITLTASGPGYLDSSDTLDITDFEELNLEIDHLSISELDGATLGRVSRTDSTSELVVQLSTDDPTQVAIQSSVTIPAGDLVSAPFPIDAIDNELLDGTRSIQLIATAADHEPAQESLSITDYEALAIIAADTASEGDGTFEFEITRPQSDSFAVVQLTSSVPSTLLLPEDVEFPFGVDSVTVTAEIANDNLVFPDREVKLIVTSSEYIGTEWDMQVLEDDVPTLELTFTTDAIDENGGSTTARISRNTRSAFTVQFSASHVDNLEFPTLLQFPRGSRFLDFDVNAIDNLVADGNRDVTITAVAAGHPAVSSDVTITDNDVPGFSFTGNVDELIASESGENATFGVVLDVSPQQNVTIQLSHEAASEFTLDTSVLVFTPEDWNVPQEVVVSAVQDTTVEPTRVWNVIGEVDSENTDAMFARLSPRQIQVSITDDDVASVQLQTTDGGTIVDELGLTDDFSLQLGSRPETDVTVVVDGSQVPEVDFEPSTLVFTPENWNQAQNVIVSTPLDFNSDQHSIGAVSIRVDESTTAEGFKELGSRVLSAVHADSVLNRLRIRLEGDDVVLQNDRDGQSLQTRNAANGNEIEFNVGTRGETVFIEPIDSGARVSLNTNEGDDLVQLSDFGLVAIDAGPGTDRVALLNDEEQLVLGTPEQVDLKNVERFDLPSSGNQSLALDLESLIAATDDRNELEIRFDEGDSVEIGDGWTFDAPTFVEGVATHRLSQQDAKLNLITGSTWQNPLIPEDVDHNLEVTPFDALLIINLLNDFEDQFLPSTYSLPQFAYYDVNNDFLLTPFDALLVINFLTRLESSAQAEQVGRFGLAGASGLIASHSNELGENLESESDSIDSSIEFDTNSLLKPSTWTPANVDQGIVDWIAETEDEEEPESTDGFGLDVSLTN